MKGHNWGTAVLVMIFLFVVFGFVQNMQQSSKRELVEQVQKLIQQNLDEKLKDANVKIKVGDVSLIKDTGNKYIGYVTLSSGSNQRQFKINVMRDSSQIMYEFANSEEIGAFLLINAIQGQT